MMSWKIGAAADQHLSKVSRLGTFSELIEWNPIPYLPRQAETIR